MRVRANIGIYPYPRPRLFLVAEDARNPPPLVDLYPYLSKRDQERIDKIVDRMKPFGLAGWVSSIVINISRKKLQQAIEENEVMEK